MGWCLVFLEPLFFLSWSSSLHRRVCGWSGLGLLFAEFFEMSFPRPKASFQLTWRIQKGTTAVSNDMGMKEYTHHISSLIIWYYLAWPPIPRYPVSSQIKSWLILHHLPILTYKSYKLHETYRSKAQIHGSLNMYFQDTMERRPGMMISYTRHTFSISIVPRRSYFLRDPNPKLFHKTRVPGVPALQTFMRTSAGHVALLPGEPG